MGTKTGERGTAPAEGFAPLGLSEDLVEVLRGMGVTRPTPVQDMAIPHVLAGRDVMARAETGTGKTIAFSGPIIDRLEASRVAVLALVLCPTRELAMQVAGVMEKLGEARGLKVALVIGGERMQGQLARLREGCQVLVGTPGRVLDLLRSRWISLAWVEAVVLDEADEMLEIGFLPDVSAILEKIPAERQTLLFSATFPPEIRAIARKHMTKPVLVETSTGISTPTEIDQVFLRVSEPQRVPAMRRILDRGENNFFLVFCDSREEVERIARQLRNEDYVVYPLHGGYDQAVRTKVMARFRAGGIRALVATDVAARGLDITRVDHVVNAAVPRTLERYLHRIGRTGRAGASGTAITLVTPAKARLWEAILRQGNLTVRERKAPEGGQERAAGQGAPGGSRGSGASSGSRGPSGSGGAGGSRGTGGSGRKPAGRPAKGSGRRPGAGDGKEQGKQREERGKGTRKTRRRGRR